MPLLLVFGHYVSLFSVPRHHFCKQHVKPNVESVQGFSCSKWSNIPGKKEIRNVHQELTSPAGVFELSSSLSQMWPVPGLGIRSIVL